MKYTIIHVNDRAKDSMDRNKKILSEFEYVSDIEFVNGNIGNPWDIINHYGIRQDVWNPYDGRVSPIMLGEMGIWISTINVWRYIVDNKIDKMLVFEDDILLQEDFIEKLNTCIKDLPDDFDFLSLYYFLEHNEISDETDIGSLNIQKSNKQYSAGQATLYSYAGAKKLFKCLKRKGLEYTSDCFIFRQSLEGLVKGYSIKHDNNFFLKHNYVEVKSLIDPENTRGTDML